MLKNILRRLDKNHRIFPLRRGKGIPAFAGMTSRGGLVSRNYTILHKLKSALLR